MAKMPDKDFSGIVCSVGLLVEGRWRGINRDGIWSHCMRFATRRGHGHNHGCVLECIAFPA